MGSTVRLILILSLLLLASALNATTCTAKSFQSLTTTDLSFSAKTQFAPGDYIRYNIKLTVPLFSLVFVKGLVSFPGALPENLILQFAVFGKGDQQIFWDSIVPKQAAGDATVSVTFIGIPGGLAVQSAAFTVSGEPATAAKYIGSDACYLCHTGLHPDIVSAYKESGHHFALNAASGGSAPAYPPFAPGVPNPPGSLAWSDTTYVVGGYGWKANFLATDGHIITDNASQYNLANSILATASEFVPYEPQLTGPKPFTCGTCHTTGYHADGNQGGLTYIVGAWNENGVGCEACHGPGSEHKANPSGIKPALDPTKSCEGCHAGGGSVLAESGFIVSQQQSSELSSGAKNSFTCTSCHNAHASVRYDDQASGSGIIKKCTDCHGLKKVGLSMGSLECIDCHMPFAVKSGASINFTDANTNNLGQADVRSHIFTINAAATSPADMFSGDGASIATGADGKAKGLTLDFVCLGCHRTGGRAATTYTFSQVKGLAPSVHK